MRGFGEIAYQGLALLAMLAHLVVVGPLSLLALYLAPHRGTELVAFVLKALVVGGWCGLGLAGIKAWRERSWAVVTVPILSFCLVWILILIGNGTIGWGLEFGY